MRRYTPPLVIKDYLPGGTKPKQDNLALYTSSLREALAEERVLQEKINILFRGIVDLSRQAVRANQAGDTEKLREITKLANQFLACIHFKLLPKLSRKRTLDLLAAHLESAEQQVSRSTTPPRQLCSRPVLALSQRRSVSDLQVAA